MEVRLAAWFILIRNGLEASGSAISPLTDRSVLTGSEVIERVKKLKSETEFQSLLIQ
jgi:hypothetical protein